MFRLDAPTPSNKVSDEIYQQIRKAEAALDFNDIEELKCIQLDSNIVNDTSVLDGETLLMTAVSKNCSLQIVELLANVPNTDFNIKSRNGESLLEIVLKYKRYEMATLLMTKYNVVNEISPPQLMKYLYSKLVYDHSNNYDEFRIDSSTGELVYSSGNKSIPQGIACEFFKYSSAYKSILASVINQSTANPLSLMHILSQKSVKPSCWEQYVVKTFAELMANSCSIVLQKPIQFKELKNPKINRESIVHLQGSSKNALQIVKLDEKEVFKKVSINSNLNELEILKKIYSCEGTVKLLHHEFDKDRITHLYLELMDGSLAETIPRLNNFGIGNFGILIQALFICMKCCETMKYLHEQKIIHYDIKPANILINLIEIDGLKLVKDVKIADFDISVTFDKVETYSATIGGTFQYMAPELYEKKFPTKSKAKTEFKLTALDVYSFGVTMHELFSQKHIENNERLESFLSKEELMKLYPCLTNDQASKIVQIGNSCLQEDPKLRKSFADLQRYFGRVIASIMKNVSEQKNFASNQTVEGNELQEKYQLQLEQLHQMGFTGEELVGFLEQYGGDINLTVSRILNPEYLL